MITNRILFYLFFLLILHILPSWTYKFETCCSNDKTPNSTANSRVLSCSLNFVIKLRSVIFYTGNGCAPSACQRRQNKYHLDCNNHRTCSISIQCIRMDASACAPLATNLNHAQHLVVDYDCVPYEPAPTANSFNQFNNDHSDLTKQDDNQNVVIFSAKINIDSPPDLINDTLPPVPDILDDDRTWKEFIIKQYLDGKQPLFNHMEKPIIIQQERSLFSEIVRTVIILIVFTLVIIVFMIIGYFLQKRVKFLRKQHIFGHHKEQKRKHQPFPNDEAYDNLKANSATSTTDTGAATDV